MKFVASKGQHVKEFDELPKLSQLDEFYWGAFRDLQPEMSSGMGLGAIPLPSMIAWCKLHGVVEQSRIKMLVSILRELEACVKEAERKQNG